MRARPRRSGFTLVELLVVMIVISIMVGLLLTAVTGAMRTAKNAAVASDINLLSTALAAFKEKHGDYPPSRVVLNENGFYDTSSSDARTTYMNATSGADITYAALAQRSVSYLRKFWPRAQFSTTGALFDGKGVFHDFNGDNVMATGPIVLEGHECLVFFLGGIPAQMGTTGDLRWAVTGWGRNPTNPFTSNRVDANRTTPTFEFAANRLSDLDNSNGFPAYSDTLGTDRPYAYFSAYGNGLYDPNDMNWAAGEPDDAGSATDVRRLFRVGFPVRAVAGSAGAGNGNDAHIAISAAPNPYTSSEANPPDQPPSWQKGQSFQIISAGADGLYGAGGQFLSDATGDKLPLELERRVTATSGPKITNLNSADASVRGREKDNIASFSGGTLD